MEYRVEPRTISGKLFGKQVRPERTVYDIRSDEGLYATVNSREDADIVTYGLNHGFLRSAFGGFADNVIAEIKKAMAGEAPAEWALARDE